MSLQMSLGRFTSLIGAKAETLCLTELELRVMRLIVSSSRGSCRIATPAEKEAFVDLVEHGFIQGPRLMDNPHRKPRPRGPKIAKLTSVARVGVEIGKLYRLMRRGELDTIEGLRMTQCLLRLKACLEQSEVERRLDEIEACVAASAAPSAIRRVHNAYQCCTAQKAR